MVTSTDVPHLSPHDTGIGSVDGWLDDWGLSLVQISNGNILNQSLPDSSLGYLCGVLDYDVVQCELVVPICLKKLHISAIEFRIKIRSPYREKSS